MPVLSHALRNAKLVELAEASGYTSVADLLHAVALDGEVPGICINPACAFVTVVSRTEDRGHCPNCNTDTVQSCLVLAGIVTGGRNAP